MNRRHFIKNLSLFTASLSTGFSPALANSSTTNPVIAKHHGMLECAAKALLPTQGYDLVAAEKVPVTNNVKLIISNLDSQLIYDLSLALSLFNNASYLLGFHFKPFEQLSVEEAQQYIRDWEEGLNAQKVIAITIKKLVYMGYWSDPKSWPGIPSFDKLSNNDSFSSLGVTEFKG